MDPELRSKLGTVEEGVEELLKIQEAELEETNRQELERGLELLKQLQEQIEAADPEGIVRTVEKLSEEQIKLIETISERIDGLEEKGDERKAEEEHDRRHAAIGVFGGVIRLTQQIAEEENLEIGKNLNNKITELKSYSSRSKK